jgi:hypothetical protein
MHEIRSSILSSGEKLAMPVARKGKAKGEGASLGGLTRIAIRREEARVTNQRAEDRIRDRVEQSIIHFRRRKHVVRVVNVSSRGAMIESDIEPRIGETLDIQFTDENRTRCLVRWLREGRIGLEFVNEAIVWGCTEPQAPVFEYRQQPGPAEQDDPRVHEVVDRSPRQTLLRKGMLYWSGINIPVRLRNISERGAKVESGRELRAGCEVELDLGEAGFQMAEVRWSKEGQLGLRFADDFDLGSLAPAARFERLSLTDLRSLGPDD